MAEKIEIKDYNPQWKNWYKRLEDLIWPYISAYALEMRHVGSTSVEGMAAKPIIDIDIVVDNFDKLDEIKNAMAQIGYIHQGNLGISDRENFKTNNDHEIPHNLYVIREDSIALKNHLLLKKHLEENRSDHKRYKDLKQKLAKKVKTRDEYGQKKTELILEFLQTQGMSGDDIDLIRSENL